MSRRGIAESHEAGGGALRAPTALLLDLLEWLAREPRRYADTMEAWRTSCPRLPVWEDAVERGFVRRERDDAQRTLVIVTESGRRFLSAHRP